MPNQNQVEESVSQEMGTELNPFEKEIDTGDLPVFDLDFQDDEPQITVPQESQEQKDAREILEQETEERGNALMKRIAAYRSTFKKAIEVSFKKEIEARDLAYEKYNVLYEEVDELKDRLKKNKTEHEALMRKGDPKSLTMIGKLTADNFTLVDLIAEKEQALEPIGEDADQKQSVISAGGNDAFIKACELERARVKAILEGLLLEQQAYRDAIVAFIKHNEFDLDFPEHTATKNWTWFPFDLVQKYV